MAGEWIAIAAGMIGGALALGGLYVLAGRKAAKRGERAFPIFVRGLSLLSLVHGLGLCLVTAAVWGCASLLCAPIPEADRRFMGLMILAGIAFVVIGGLGLVTRRLPGSCMLVDYGRPTTPQ